MPTLSLEQAAEAMGIDLRTLQNRRSAMRCGRDPGGPVPPVIETGPRTAVVPSVAFENFLAELTVEGYIPAKSKQKRRGRPTKAEQIAMRE